MLYQQKSMTEGVSNNSGLSPWISASKRSCRLDIVLGASLHLKKKHFTWYSRDIGDPRKEMFPFSWTCVRSAEAGLK
jgi:hypothetical protein